MFSRLDVMVHILTEEQSSAHKLQDMLESKHTAYLWGKIMTYSSSSFIGIGIGLKGYESSD